jgi:hypothetical protein
MEKVVVNIMAINQDGNAIVSRDDLDKLINQRDEFLIDVELTAEKITSLLGVLGLIQDGKLQKGLKPLIRSLPRILKDLVVDPREIERKFGFMNELTPLLEKYKPGITDINIDEE